MRVERLVIEAGDDTFTLDLHPRLTVVAGMGRVERESLIGELIGALGGSRAGVHVELEEQRGRHLAVFRPTTGHHRIVDVDRARDVTSELSGADGACDLLGHLGLDATTARRTMRFTASDLTTTTDRSRAVDALAGLDQRRVWAAAEALDTAEHELATESEALGTAPEDAAIIEAVESRHHAFEQAAARFETTRRRTFLIGGLASIGTLPAVLAAGTSGLGLLGVAVVAVIASLVSRAQLLRAARAEERALAAAGANTYLGFQLQRVNTLLGDDSTRQAVMGAAERRRSALGQWQRLAGDIAVEWALANREEIETAARLRHEVRALGALSATAPGISADVSDELAQALVTRLAAARSLAGEGVPLLLDDPFHQLDASVKLLLLELLGRSAGEPQIVILTEDDDVASWARLEALTGEVALIEPVPTHDEARDTTITL